jgi:Predicted transcriptional regulators
MTVFTRSATPVDVFAGQRLRAFRINAGLSQSAVAEALGVTFQQVQKYEKGANRMGASRLDALAGLLGVKVADFFDEDDRPKRKVHHLMVESSQERRLIPAFRQLNPTQRAAVIEIVGAMMKKEI